MWILTPSITSAFAAATGELTSASNEQLAEAFARSLLSRSKHSPQRTWLQRLKRDSWTTHLSGAISSDSLGESFTDWWTSSLAATRANPSAQPASDSAPKTHDTSGRLSQPELLSMRPAVCFFENVEGHISLGLRDVLQDLVGLGYRATWCVASASECGAPHQRKRVFILAERNNEPSLAGIIGTVGSEDAHDLEKNGRQQERRPAAAPERGGKNARDQPFGQGQQQNWPSRPGRQITAAESPEHGSRQGLWHATPRSNTGLGVDARRNTASIGTTIAAASR
jgi:hypothetical protein